MCSLMVTNSSPLRTTYLRQNLASIMIHVTSRVLHVFIGLVEVCVSIKKIKTFWELSQEWCNISQKKKKKKNCEISGEKNCFLGITLKNNELDFNIFSHLPTPLPIYVSFFGNPQLCVFLLLSLLILSLKSSKNNENGFTF
jgi:hypothetical protein